MNWAFRAKIVRIIDGDTLEAEFDLGFNIKTIQRVRLLGVFAPELHGVNHAAGAEAKKVMEEIVSSFSAAMIETKLKPSGAVIKSFERYIADVYLCSSSDFELSEQTLKGNAVWLNQRLRDLGIHGGVQ